MGTACVLSDLFLPAVWKHTSCGLLLSPKPFKSVTVGLQWVETVYLNWSLRNLSILNVGQISFNFQKGQINQQYCILFTPYCQCLRWRGFSILVVFKHCSPYEQRITFYHRRYMLGLLKESHFIIYLKFQNILLVTHAQQRQQNVKEKTKCYTEEMLFLWLHWLDRRLVYAPTYI